jgi:hypothetical protein
MISGGLRSRALVPSSLAEGMMTTDGPGLDAFTMLAMSLEVMSGTSAGRTRVDAAPRRMQNLLAYRTASLIPIGEGSLRGVSPAALAAFSASWSDEMMTPALTMEVDDIVVKTSRSICRERYLRSSSVSSGDSLILL